MNLTTDTKITGRVVSAGRALAGIGRKDFAKAAGLPFTRVTAIEATGSAWLRSAAERAAILRAFDHFGVVLIGEDGNMGAGVRLKFTRQDAGQIARLEGEGGIVGADDAP